MKSRILVVDDEKDMAILLKRTLEPELGSIITTAFSAEMALTILSHEQFDLVLCDIRMPGMDGFELLDHVKEHYPGLTMVMITAFGSIDVAVSTIKKGAYDFISKPFDREDIIFRVKKALERSQLLKENQELQNEKKGTLGKLIGKSPAMHTVFQKIHMVAESDVTVLITGESGTGKDLTAQSIHHLSHRSKKPYVPINCPTVPEHILESELFGYRKGAFTNAIRDKNGLFQEADQGTLFLDEIGDISPTIQTKLLRVLQEREIKPLGDTKSIKIDVRILASTNRNLYQKINDGEFREDFFYRLNVFTIELPPLRERIIDIPSISEHLVTKHCKKLNRPEKKISPKLMARLMKQSWPGNVRELENAIIQGILSAETDTITCSDIELAKNSAPISLPDEFYQEGLQELPYKEAKEKMLTRFNHNYLGAMLSLSNGNITNAAKRCRLERQALQQIMKRYQINGDKFR